MEQLKRIFKYIAMAEEQILENSKFYPFNKQVCWLISGIIKYTH